MTTIAEKLTGKSAQEYIPIEKRQENQVETDGPGNRYRVFEWVRHHPGEELHANVVGAEIGTSAVNVNYHLNQLVKHKKVRREGGRGQGSMWARYWITSLAPLQTQRLASGRTKKGDGPVTVTRPAAPISVSEHRKIELEAWDYIKGLGTLEAEAVGQHVKSLLGFLEHLEAKSPKATISTIEQGGGSSTSHSEPFYDREP